MKKLRVCSLIVLAICLLVSVSMATANADDVSNLETVQRIVNKTNLSIEQDIERVRSLCEGFQEHIEDAVLRTALIEHHIELLVEITNAKASAAINAAEKLGVEVECQMVAYTICKNFDPVLIDPLYIVSD